MLRIIALAASCTFGVASAASAANAIAPVPSDSASIVKVGEGCGAGRWRGPYGGCNNFNSPYGSYRGTSIECPPGYHIGSGRGRCWPNR